MKGGWAGYNDLHHGDKVLHVSFPTLSLSPFKPVYPVCHIHPTVFSICYVE